MSGRSALITGASRGIGLGIATRLAQQGFGLTITARSEETLHAVAAELSAAGAPEVVVLAGDAADPESPASVVAAHRGSFDSLDVLVVNAGVGTAGTVGEFPMKRYDKTMDVNLRTPLAYMQESLPLLRRAAELRPTTGATVIAMSSITGVFAEPGLGVYGASKAALLSLVDTFNVEESGRGVVATSLAPAFIDTDMSAWAHDQVSAEDMIPVSDVLDVVDMLIGLSPNTMISRIVMGRSGTSGFVA
ncbi:MAG: 3-oxoacyl-[acyl-carrier-protein] reductase FabG [Aeromicrobium sp.]|jgi:3-oxoacyl-[acyl-carrier protein] reductase|nr:3-oxoacyl-[acyl-carrier-protein] reductase FabG [Aeromicrobium sp.]